jgi:hypothetical protein
MPPETQKTPRWQLVLAYGAFAFVAFILCLALTFPYDTLRARIVTASSRRRRPPATPCASGPCGPGSTA